MPGIVGAVGDIHLSPTPSINLIGPDPAMRYDTQPLRSPARPRLGRLDDHLPDLKLCPDLPPSSVLSAVSLLRATGSSTWLNSSHEYERPAWMPSGAGANRKSRQPSWTSVSVSKFRQTFRLA